MKYLSKIYLAILFLLLYAPIMVLVVFSFNESGNLGSFDGFSFKWYGELFRDKTALEALKNSLVLATVSSLLATVIGTFAVFGIEKMRNRYAKAVVSSVTNIPMMNPDIVTGVSMMLLFVAVGGILQIDGLLGSTTMFIAHTTFCLPYVILSILPRFRQMDKSLSEAALDLGCTPMQTFFKIELPFLLPAILSGLMMGFALSLDDFVISHFVSSPDFQTLPLYVYNQTVHEVKFSMYALCTLMIVVLSGLLVFVNFSGKGKEEKKPTQKKRREAVS